MPRSDTAPVREAVASWLKIIGTAFSIISVIVVATLYASNHDKRLALLETTVAQHERVVSGHAADINVLEKWAPTVDLKLDLLLQHFGIRVPTT